MIIAFSDLKWDQFNLARHIQIAVMGNVKNKNLITKRIGIKHLLWRKLISECWTHPPDLSVLIAHWIVEIVAFVMIHAANPKSAVWLVSTKEAICDAKYWLVGPKSGQKSPNAHQMSYLCVGGGGGGWDFFWLQMYTSQ